MKQKTIYYSDPLNDDFAATNITPKPLPDNYKYVKTGFPYRVAKFVLYSVIARSVAALYVKLLYLQTTKNRSALRTAKDTGFFLYGNHTQYAADAFIPNVVTFPKTNYILVSPDATSIKGIRWLVTILGGVPVPGIKQYRDFLRAMETYSSHNVVTIYPEAHIWPYYTDIRPFSDVSFDYPVRYGKPVFSFTNVYKKKLVGTRPRIQTYIDGPFYPDNTLSSKEARLKLRNDVYNAMKSRVQSNDSYAYIRYEYRPK